MIGDGDVAAIMASGDWNVAAVFGGSLTVQGWFTSESDATTLYGQVDIEAQKPSFMCDTSDIVAVQNRTAVVINGTTYTVQRIEKVGTGMSVVWLQT